MSWVSAATLYLLLLAINCSTIEGRNTPSKNEILQCKDENDQPVDWYVMYKIPKISETSDPMIKKGFSYMYMTSETAASGWKLSKKNISSGDSIPGNTLSLLYKDDVASRSMWVMYNDHAPNSTANAKYGHTKGVVMTDGVKGFWLIHSVPGFPPVPRTGNDRTRRRSSDQSEVPTVDKVDYTGGEYSYPNSGTNYGQSFLCVSMKADQVDVIARQLMYNQIIVYRKNLPSSLASEYPVFVNASNQIRIRDAPYNKKATIRSADGAEFISFAKSDKWQKDLYDDFVAPQLNSDLLTETWLNGRGRLPSDCTGPRVNNVESIAMREANVDFKSSRDHSKWAISTTSGKKRNWVCIGDINRAETQFSRGGGTVCYNSQNLWTNYKNAVGEVEPCPRKIVMMI